MREHGHGERRLKYPMKLVDGKWKQISWDEAIDEVGDQMLEIREQSGPDSVYWLGSAKHNNEQAYLFRKFAGLLGHQQRGPPGAHLPLHHGRRRRQHLGLRRHDQLLQRHPQLQGHPHHRRQPRRGAPGVAAARVPRQGAQQRAADRHRPALHAHRGPCRPVHAHPPGHRRAGDLRHAVAYLRERLGGQGVHPPARLGHGRGEAGGRQVDAGRGGARQRRARATWSTRPPS